MKLDLLKTNDGSFTLFLPEMNETYHSKFGAINEAKHVFIKEGFEYFLKNNKDNRISILEIGFGTGLNTFLTFLKNAELYGNVYYEAIEKYPLNDEIVKQLNYTETKEQKHFFDFIHQEKWDEKIVVAEHFCLKKRNIDLHHFQSDKKFDIVYFDAFAPDKQPEMWTHEVFEKIYKLMNRNGIIVTYSAKGSVRRTMQDVGFEMERIPGPPGKREMLRGFKS